MTIDEVIRHCEEVAEKHERHAKILKKRLLGSGLDTVDYCLQCAADQRQLVGWLKELKELRCKVFADDPLIDTTIEMLDTELREAKRLLKLAVEDFKFLGVQTEDEYGSCGLKDCNCDLCVLGGGNLADNCQWRYANEALKLIGDERNEP